MTAKQKFPALRCPECGDLYYFGDDGYGGHMPSYQAEDVPHPDPKDCIRHLRNRLENIERTLERHNF